jgi:hypothetical protein
LSELGEYFHKYYYTVFRVAVWRIFGMPSPHILSNLCPTHACAYCHFPVQTMHGAFQSAGVDM